jgi:hypothetical protein
MVKNCDIAKQERNIMKYIFGILMAFCFVCTVSADDVTTVANNTGNSAGIDMSYREKIETVSILENDLMILDTEIAKCQKSKKGWIAATVVGSAGVVATGVAAGVQGAQISQNKKDIEKKNTEILDKTKTLNDLEAKL